MDNLGKVCQSVTFVSTESSLQPAWRFCAAAMVPRHLESSFLMPGVTPGMALNTPPDFLSALSSLGSTLNPLYTEKLITVIK